MRSRVRDQRVRGGHRRNAAAAAAITVVEEGVQRREREKDDSQTKWRERMKTRREREGGCFAVHCRRSWGQLKPPPLLGLAVLLSSLSASTIDFLRFISAIFDANGTDAILSFEKFCCNLPRPLLQLMKPELFDFIDKYNLQDSIHEKVVQLMMLDCKHVVPLLIQHRDLISPQEVVKQLLNADVKCDCRYFLHLYLHSLFEVNPHAGKDFHDIHVELYADYDPKMLLPFLHSSQHYTLEKAYEICTKKELLKEQVFILGRMRNSKQALAVIINKLGDIKEAVEFVTMQNDYELWEELIKQCIDKPEMVGMLLEHTVGNLDPLYIVNKVPNGLKIPR
nr:vacuolar protein sorting-associated protein 41 homolog isoform X6 [Arachis hypogaea]